MTRYQVTIAADTLQDLTGRLTEMAAALQAGDALQLAAAPAAQDADNGARPAALPLPPPDYQATGLTEHQAYQARQAAPAPIYVPPSQAVAVLPPAPDAGGAPLCRNGHGAMIWKGGGLSKNGKNLPLWSCRDTACDAAVWPPR